MLRIAVVFNLYYILWRDYRNLKKVTNLFFFGIKLLVVGLFINFYDPAVYFMVFIFTYLGRWSMLLVLLLSVLILLIARFSDIKLNPAYKYLVLGFLVFSGLQFLNFGYLEIFGEKYTAIRQKTYPPTIMLDHTQVILGLARLDRQAGHILRKVIHFWNRENPRADFCDLTENCCSR